MPADESSRDAYEAVARLLSLIEELRTVTGVLARPVTRESIDKIADRHVYIIGKVTIVMPDNYVNHGQVGAFGKQARSGSNTFQQVIPGHDIDHDALAKQLEAVRVEMRRIIESNNIDQEIEIGNVALAERSATMGDEHGLLKYLKSAGRWTLDVAKSIAADLVVSALKAQMGNP